MKPCFECDTLFAGDEAMCYGCLLDIDERIEGDLELAICSSRTWGDFEVSLSVTERMHS